MPRMLKTPQKILSLLLLTSFLSGCMGFSFWFERADRLALWRLDNMFELSDPQEMMAEPMLSDMKEWFRYQAFPDLLEDFKQAEDMWEQDELVPATETVIFSVTENWDEFLVYSWPKVKPLLEQMTEANARAYEEYADERMDEWFDERESLEAKREDRQDKLEDWFDDLSDEQVAIMNRYTTLFENELEIVKTNSSHRRHKFLQTALAGDMEALKMYYLEPRRLDTPEYSAWWEWEKQQWQTMLRELLPTLDPDQKAHAEDRMEDWIAKLEGVIPETVAQVDRVEKFERPRD